MTYRSDRDAAKHRVKVLEHELAEAKARAEGGEGTVGGADTRGSRGAATVDRAAKRERRGGRGPGALARMALPVAYVVAMVAVAGLAFALVRPDRMGHWAYTAGVVGGGAVAGGFVVAARKVPTDIIFYFGLFGFFVIPIGGVVRCVGAEREICRMDQKAERPSQFAGRVSASERRDDVSAAAPCSLTVKSLYVRECGRACDVVLRCGEVTLLDERDFESCYARVDKLRMVRGTEDSDELGIDLTIELATRRGTGVVYHDPKLGRLPWRIELAFD